MPNTSFHQSLQFADVFLTSQTFVTNLHLLRIALQVARKIAPCDGVFNLFLFISGPKPETVNDFWRMIFEFKCPTIVMLTTLKEMGKVRELKNEILMQRSRIPYFQLKGEARTGHGRYCFGNGVLLDL